VLWRAVRGQEFPRRDGEQGGRDGVCAGGAGLRGRERGRRGAGKGGGRSGVDEGRGGGFHISWLQGLRIDTVGELYALGYVGRSDGSERRRISLRGSARMPCDELYDSFAGPSTFCSTMEIVQCEPKFVKEPPFSGLNHGSSSDLWGGKKERGEYNLNSLEDVECGRTSCTVKHPSILVH